MSEHDARPMVVIPADAEFEGTLVLPRPARIDGRVRGCVLAESDVWVGESGFVGADLAADRIVVAGTVEGEVRARTSIELHATGRVRGGLTAPTLRLAEGAVVDGDCRSGRRAAEASNSRGGSA